jgi:ATP-dependent protease ClpP protease subunit
MFDNSEENTLDVISVIKKSGNPAASRIDIPHRIIYICDILDDYISCGIISILPFLIDKSDCDPITIKICCGGGNVTSILSLIHEFNKLDVPIVTEITGIAYSGGALIASVGDERLITKYGELMYHYPVWAVPFERGMHEHEADIRRTKESYNRLLVDIASKTTLSFKEFTDHFLTNDWFLTPKEALKHKLVTGII